MLSLYRTLSLGYLSRRWVRAFLIVACIALGVLALVATRALSQTMAKASLGNANPIAGQADLVISNGELLIDAKLAKELAKVPGVKSVRPRIFDNVKIVKPESLKDRNVLVMGIDLEDEKTDDASLDKLTFSDEVKNLLELLSNFKQAVKQLNLDLDQLPDWIKGRNPFAGKIVVVPGKELNYDLQTGGKQKFEVRKNGLSKAPIVVDPLGWVQGEGPYAILGGYVIVTDLESAAQVLEIPKGKVQRIDLALEPGVSRPAIRSAIELVLAKRAKVATPGEQDQSLHSVMDGMQVGFSLGGMAALVVALFLVYMALSVSVAERRHEIGILKSLGGTQGQIIFLFAGEALLLGLVGSLIGVPLGYLTANWTLAPVQDIVRDIFGQLDARQVDYSWPLTFAAVATGMITSLAACLAPAISASRENPAEAVRRIPKAVGKNQLVGQAVMSLALVGIGVGLVMTRGWLPIRWGTYGGLVFVLIGALVACPIFAAGMARTMHPVIRLFLGVEWRIAGDNLVRSPARTGLVIGALAAGVALVIQTAGLILSNRVALRTWVQESIAADLIVSSGGPVGSGGKSQPMAPSVAKEFLALNEVEAVLPIRFSKVPFRETLIFLITVDAPNAYLAEKKRLAKGDEVELYKTLTEQPGAIIVSDNFAAKHGVGAGDTITLTSPTGEVRLRIIGAIADYSWNSGSVFINRPDFLRYWQDDQVDVFDVFLRPGADPVAMKNKLNSKFGTRFDLFVLTRLELQTRIDDMIGGLYGIAYAQQFIVMLVAGLGVIMALLISVLQRRREMGLLRAIGASQSQVIYSVLAEAGLMGFMGTLIGLTVGIPLQWFVLQIVILEESGFLFPVHVPWGGALVVASCAMALAILAGLAPAYYAVRTRIPDAIAYE